LNAEEQNKSRHDAGPTQNATFSYSDLQFEVRKPIDLSIALPSRMQAYRFLLQQNPSPAADRVSGGAGLLISNRQKTR
jgi:hypothetical protein